MWLMRYDLISFGVMWKLELINFNLSPILLFDLHVSQHVCISFPLIFVIGQILYLWSWN